MKTIKFTYIDHGTGLSVEKEPALNLVFPDIKGLNYLFALERKYPTMVPEFIGTCDDDADLGVEGFIKLIDQEELLYEQSEECNFQELRIRADRNSRLFACDWTQGKDIDEDVSSVWATYRQALRDLPQQEGFPWRVIWPEQP
jgi:hypothetical protein